jgi:EAL domain-containing protein (putative c-di-GMP-specific phosphodiesterase class I)
VIAEGIEDRATADFLLSMGCEDGQGYFFGRPMPVADFDGRFVSVLRAEETASAGRQPRPVSAI